MLAAGELAAAATGFALDGWRRLVVRGGALVVLGCGLGVVGAGCVVLFRSVVGGSGILLGAVVAGFVAVAALCLFVLLFVFFLLAVVGKHHRAAIDDLVFALELQGLSASDDLPVARIANRDLVFARFVAVRARHLEREAGA